MFKIGDFSRLARVTVRTLHHYDEAGLLRPAYVDQRSGYRYYNASQLETLQRILLLKDLGFPLEDVRYLLNASLSRKDFLRLLDARRRQLAESIAVDESRLRRLDVLRECVEHDRVEAPAVSLRETAALDVHTMRARVPRLAGFVQDMFEKAESAVARELTRANASPLLIFHDLEYREENVDVEVCIPVKRRTDSLASRTLPACGSLGCVTYAGAYEQTPDLYAAMLQWMARAGLRIAGPLREVYHRFGANEVGYRLPSSMLTEHSTEYVTELQVPVSPIEGHRLLSDRIGIGTGESAFVGRSS